MSFNEILGVSPVVSFLVFSMICFSTVLFIGGSQHVVLPRHEYLRKGLGFIVLGVSALLLFGCSKISLSINGVSIPLDDLVHMAILMLILVGLIFVIIEIRGRSIKLDGDGEGEDFRFNEQLIDDDVSQTPVLSGKNECLLLFDESSRTNTKHH